MKHSALVTLGFLLACNGQLSAAENDIAPTGTLRAVYIGSNMAQATQDRATGAIRGPSADVARELGRRLGVPTVIAPVASPQPVIDAVIHGQADIGFVGFAASRVGTIEFSQNYMLVQQTFLVLDGSTIHSVADVDRAGQKAAGVRTDSTTAWMTRHFKQATVLELDKDVPAIVRMLTAKEIDAFAGNRQRQVSLMNATPGTRVLPDSMIRIPQTIIVPKGKLEALAAVNRFLDEIRTSGFLRDSIARNGVIGVDVALGGSWQPSAP